MARKKLTPWQKIIRARDRGTGLRLSAEEIRRLGCDDAIEARAQLDDWEDENPGEEYYPPTQRTARVIIRRT